MDASSIHTPDYALQLDLIFGSDDDPMPTLAERAKRLLPGHNAIVWEGDAATFQFLYVSDSAEEVLGYPARRWVEEPTFWADTVLHPEDRDDAIAFCALCTGKKADHDFEYRAVAADGRVVWLHDIVRVVKGEKGIATRLRGVMIEVDARKTAELGPVPLAAGAKVRTDVLEQMLRDGNVLPGLAKTRPAASTGEVPLSN
jgi:PAS domain S-box-containing protein